MIESIHILNIVLPFLYLTAVLVYGYDFLKGQKASVLQLPERIEFIDEMPYTGVQKTDKRFLQEDIAKKLNAAGQGT